MLGVGQSRLIFETEYKSRCSAGEEVGDQLAAERVSNASRLTVYSLILL